MTKEIPFEPHPFWDFSLAVYGTVGVAPACLDLQDRRGIDVNMLLFCLWAGCDRALAFDMEGIRSILETSGDWQRTVVQPMRAVRRRLKLGSRHLGGDITEGLRTQLLATEIACEHGEQLIIAAAADGVSFATREMKPAAAVAANLAAYAASAGIRLDAADATALEAVLAARLEGDEIAAVLDAVLATD